MTVSQIIKPGGYSNDAKLADRLLSISFLLILSATTILNLITGHNSTPTESLFDIQSTQMVLVYLNISAIVISIMFLYIFFSKKSGLSLFSVLVLIFYAAFLLSDMFGFEKHLSLSLTSSAIVFFMISVLSSSGARINLSIRNYILIYLIFNLVSMFIIPGFALQYNYDGLFSFRMHGIANQANSLAPYASAMIYILLVTPYNDKIKYYFSLATSTLILLITQSKTSMLLTVVIFVFSFFDRRNSLNRTQRFSLSVILLPICVGMIIYIVNSESLSFITDDDNLSSFSGRDSVWSFALDAWRLNPIFGYGYSSLWNDNMISSFAAIYNWMPHYSHNLFVQVLAESGILGIFALAVLISYFCFRIVRNVSLMKYTTLGFFLCLIVIRGFSEVTLGNGLFTDNSVIQSIIMIFIIQSVQRGDTSE